MPLSFFHFLLSLEIALRPCEQGSLVRESRDILERKLFLFTQRPRRRELIEFGRIGGDNYQLMNLPVSGIGLLHSERMKNFRPIIRYDLR